MPQFLFDAVDQSGKAVTERIEAETLENARRVLEEKGYGSIVFHYDEIFADLKDRYEDNKTRLDPKMELKCMKIKGIWDLLLSSVIYNAIFWVPILILNLYVVYRGRPYGILGWTGIILAILFVLFFLFVTLPGVLYGMIIHSYTWNRWDRMRRYIKILQIRQRIPILAIPQMAMDLDFRLACALAAEKNLEGALKMVSRYEQDRKVDHGMYYTRVGDIYSAAGKDSEMIEYKIKAAELSDLPAYTIDLAFAHVRSFRDSKKASEVLRRIEEKEIAGPGILVVKYTKGLICLEEGNYEKARNVLEEVHQLILEKYRTPLIEGTLANVNAYWAIALAQCGEKEKARAVFRTAEELIKSQSDHTLLSRCRQAIGRI